MRQCSERLDLFFREIWIGVFAPANVELSGEVVTDQPVEAVPVQVQESGGAFRPGQQLPVEIIGDFGIPCGAVFWC